MNKQTKFTASHSPAGTTGTAREAEAWVVPTLSGDGCSQCGEPVASNGNYCRDCWEEINGQFGVGA